MATHASAEKRSRQANKITSLNRGRKSVMRTHVKACREAVAAGDQAKARAALAQATRHLDRAARRNVIRRETAARTISRLARAVNALSARAA